MQSNFLSNAPVIPLVQSDDPEIAVAITKSLLAGGLNVIEVVLRTDSALDCLARIKEEVPEAIVGAGTVLTKYQVDEVKKCGAQFIVSPGLNEAVVMGAKAHGLEIFPGIVTPSEAQLAWNLGLRTVKFFPAGLAGGVPMLKALSSVFRGMKFMPTGGVSAKNLGEFLEVPAVIACGGSWLTPADEIANGNYSAITKLAQEALSIAEQVNQ